MSAPPFGARLLLDLEIPFLPRLRALVELPYPRRHVFDGERY